MYDDRDLIIRTLIGEAANQGDLGQAAVAHVIRNRLNSGRYGNTVPDVLFAPKQFEPWNTRRNELMSIPTDSPAYIKAAQVVDAVQGGKIEDPTRGATHFANIDTVKARGNTAGMRWITEGLDNGSAVRIGAHTFMSPDSQPGSKSTKASTQPMPYGMPQIMGGQGQDPGLPPLLQQEQQGGLAGLFGDPTRMAYLAMIAKGLNPWSELNPQEMLAQAQRQRLAQAQQFYERQKDQQAQANADRSFSLQKERFQFDKADKEADNARQALTPLAKDIIEETGFKPGSEQYKAEYKRRKAMETEEYKRAQREKDAEAQGLVRGSPAFQSYVLTGKVGRDETLTAGDRKAIQTAEDELPNLEQTVATLKRAQELNDKTFTGYTASIRGQIGAKLPGAGMVMDQDAAKSTLEFENIMSTEAVTTMADTLKGATTDFELREFKSRLADPSTPPDIRKRIIDRMAKLAERQLKIKSDRLNQLRGGTYYKQGGGASASPGGSAPDPLGIR